MGGYGLLLSTHSADKEPASAFILWAASKKIHREIVLEGGSPIRLSEIRDAEILERYPFLSFYDQLIEHSVYRARIPQWPELEDIISRELSAVMREEKVAAEATAAIQSWITETIAR